MHFDASKPASCTLWVNSKPKRSVSGAEFLRRLCERILNAPVLQVCQRAQHTVVAGCHRSQSFNHRNPPFCSCLVPSYHVESQSPRSPCSSQDCGSTYPLVAHTSQETTQSILVLNMGSLRCLLLSTLLSISYKGEVSLTPLVSWSAPSVRVRVIVSGRSLLSAFS
jgi:hypothetical protein